MRKPIRSNSGRVQTSLTKSLPAPIGGWNARDSVASMEETDAVYLDNWFPTPSDVMLRKGRSAHVTDIGDWVESLMAYSTPSGTQTLFAAADDSFYNVTSAGAVGAAVVTGLTNARWYHTNFTNSSGTSYLCCFNGVDEPQYWNGANWLSIDAVSTPAITGVTTTGLVFPWQHKRRMWLLEAGTLKAWYLPVDAVGGAAAAIDLSGIAKLGGYLVAGGTWTLDAGEGVDDYWVAVTSEGEVIVYRGTDPSSGSTWSIVGVWRLGRPLGRRCLMKMAGDLLYIAEDGVWPLSKALMSDKTNPRVAITDKITAAMNDAGTTHGTNFGWQLLFYPKAPFVLLNIPVSETADQEQYVMNSISGAWCRFSGIEASCWEIFQGEPYFGGDGVVKKFWATQADDGDSISGDAKQAFSYFGRNGQRKQWIQARPLIQTNGAPALRFGFNVDYKDDDAAGQLAFNPTDGSAWGVSAWGVGLWGSGLRIVANWLGVSAVGMCAAPRLKAISTGVEVRWQATDVIFKAGGVV